MASNFSIGFAGFNCPVHPTRFECITNHLQTCAVAADRDRQFAEAVREAWAQMNADIRLDKAPTSVIMGECLSTIKNAHLRIYNRPCTAATPDSEKEK